MKLQKQFLKGCRRVAEIVERDGFMEYREYDLRALGVDNSNDLSTEKKQVMRYYFGV